MTSSVYGVTGASGRRGPATAGFEQCGRSAAPARPTIIMHEKVELRLIIDTIPQYIIVLEPDGKLLQVLDYSGFTADDVQTPEFRTRLLHPTIGKDWQINAGGLSLGVNHLNWNCDLSERMIRRRITGR